MKLSPHLVPHPEKSSEAIWSQSYDPFHSITLPLLEMHQSQVCLTRYYGLYCVTFLPHVMLILISLACWQGPTICSLQKCMLVESLILLRRRSCLSLNSQKTSLMLLVWTVYSYRLWCLSRQTIHSSNDWTFKSNWSFSMVSELEGRVEKGVLRGKCPQV